ncbi:MAG: bifunctional 5,10-methylene-tetrahydrofolate dehydrogenase/5,10-methylene-tetrahydrofolate cyclohydrolase, partial [Armatimonadetes bacterium]|nr:bifunctional 5,10-methylene-tetrahydrofolate dehydrogenase/5,10-methylene-tetrahydrofolate cyclohydrolase [Armatimonadota bacterium]
MPAQLLEGGPIAEQIKEELRERLAQLEGPTPKLVALMAGENPGAVVYARQQEKACG